MITLRHTSTHEITACTIPEVMEHSVSVVLKHLCMDVKAWIPKFCDFLG